MGFTYSEKSYLVPSLWSSFLCVHGEGGLFSDVTSWYQLVSLLRPPGHHSHLLGLVFSPDCTISDSLTPVALVVQCCMINHPKSQPSLILLNWHGGQSPQEQIVFVPWCLGPQFGNLNNWAWRGRGLARHLPLLVIPGSLSVASPCGLPRMGTSGELDCLSGCSGLEQQGFREFWVEGS